MDKAFSEVFKENRTSLAGRSAAFLAVFDALEQLPSTDSMECVLKAATTLMQGMRTRWVRLVATSPSGKTLYVCTVCGRLSSTPDKACKTIEDPEEKWQCSLRK